MPRVHAVRISFLAGVLLLLVATVPRVCSQPAAQQDAAIVPIAEPSPIATIFEPTDDWKEIGPNEHLPGGLDIRIDFAAGKKYARNLPRTATPTAAAHPAINGVALQAAAAGGALVAVPDTSVDASTTSTAPHAAAAPDSDLDEAEAQMASVLLALPEPDPSLTDALARGVRGEELQALLRRIWAHRQSELKEAMSSAKTEAQLMQELLSRLLSSSDAPSTGSADEDALVDTLEGLEAYVAQLHNAEDFMGMGGLIPVTLLLNASSLRVAAAAAWTLGTAVKYAPRVAAAAVDSAALPMLLDLLARATRSMAALPAPCETPREWTHAHTAAARAVYALGALLRGCAHASNASDAIASQMQQYTGASVITDAFDAHHTVLTSLMARTTMDECAQRFAVRTQGFQAKVLALAADVAVDERDAIAAQATSPAGGVGAPMTILDADTKQAVTQASAGDDVSTAPSRLRALLCDAWRHAATSRTDLESLIVRMRTLVLSDADTQLLWAVGTDALHAGVTALERDCPLAAAAL